jgi:Tol biopolymer transport system component
MLRRGPWPQWDAAFSPDGSLLAFRGYWGVADGAYSLYTTGTNGCAVHRLTRSIAGHPTWSPDGKWIVFDTSGAGEIWKVRADGSGMTRLAASTHSYFQDQPAWSPNGREIAFVRYYGSRGQLWVMRPDGSGKRLVRADSRASVGDPAWSYDSKQLAFVRQLGQTPWIETVNSDGSSARRLLAAPADSWNPVWLPHDTGIAFLSGLVGSGDLYATRVGSKTARKIATLDTPQFTWKDAALPRRSC